MSARTMPAAVLLAGIAVGIVRAKASALEPIGGPGTAIAGQVIPSAPAAHDLHVTVCDDNPADGDNRCRLS